MERRIVCFGDSNTYGLNPVTGGRYDREHRWPAVMQKRLEESGQIFDVVSEGLSARTTIYADAMNWFLCGYDYMIPCLLSHSPIDLLIIMLGTNDCGVAGITAEGVTQGAEKLVNAALSLPVWTGAAPFMGQKPVFKNKILLVAPAAMENHPQDTYLLKRTKCSHELSDAYKELAEKLGVEFFDANEYVKVGDYDYVHLTEMSHVTLGEAFAKKVESMLL